MIDGLCAGWDWNTALTVLEDNSAVALIRGGMVWHADVFDDNTTWKAVGVNATGVPGPEGPQWSGIGVEGAAPAALAHHAAADHQPPDPFIWVDGRGVYHALAHAFDPFFGRTSPPCAQPLSRCQRRFVSGVHAFVRPEDVPTDWRDPNVAMRWTVSGVAYTNLIHFNDGHNQTFSRRERPHLVWGPEGPRGAPIALSNGVDFGAHANTPFEDGVFTLVQPIRN